MLDNSKEEYPVLNFRSVTYFPLTWRFTADEFGWKYDWNQATGLSLETGNPFRPVIDDTTLGNHSPTGTTGKWAYVYSDDYYVGYPGNPVMNYDTALDLVIRKKGEAEKEYSYKTYLESGYFNAYASPGWNGSPMLGGSDTKPSIKGNVLTIAYAKAVGDFSTGAGTYENTMVEINLDTGYVMSETPVN